MQCVQSLVQVREQFLDVSSRSRLTANASVDHRSASALVLADADSRVHVPVAKLVGDLRENALLCAAVAAVGLE